MNVVDILNKRYSTKKFDPSKQIPEEDFKKLKEILRLSPSSTNSQPWHFIIANTDEGKKRMAKGTQNLYSFNENKVLDASLVVLFCSKIDIDEAYIQYLLAQEEKDGRFPSEEIKKMQYQTKKVFSDIHKYDLKDQLHWLEKQVYLNAGNFLLGVAALGLYAVPMEGIDVKILDEEFGLREKGFTSLFAVSVGYKSESDFNATSPKSRLPEEEIITVI